MIYQSRKDGSTDWQDAAAGDVPGNMQPGYEYRIKPYAPKWPKSMMTALELRDCFAVGRIQSHIANQIIAHACEANQVVPIELHSERMKSQNAPFIEALASAAKRERELGEALHDSIMKRATLQDTEQRDIAIAINVRAACHAKFPGHVTNDELNRIISGTK